MTQTTISRDPGPPVTFGGVAREVTNTVFPRSVPREYDESYRAFNRHSLASEGSGSGSRRTYTTRGVERPAESDLDLPSYGEPIRIQEGSVPTANHRDF